MRTLIDYGEDVFLILIFIVVFFKSCDNYTDHRPILLGEEKFKTEQN